MLILFSIFISLAQAESTYVMPLKVYVGTNLKNVPDLSQKVKDSFAAANRRYENDVNGPVLHDTDMACDTNIVIDKIEIIPSWYPKSLPFSEPKSAFLDSNAYVSFATDIQWFSNVWTNFSRPIDEPSGAGWVIAHEHLHTYGANHDDKGCNIMHYGGGIPAGCGIERDESLSVSQCERLLRGSIKRKDWEKKRYDCNQSGSVNVIDMVCFSTKVSSAIFSSRHEPSLDYNQDFQTNVGDIIGWVSAVNSFIFNP